MTAERKIRFVHRFWRSPALPFAEFRRAGDSRACYAPHAHAFLSLGAVDGGRSVFRRDGSSTLLSRGDVVFIPAGEVHSCNPENEGRWSYQMLYLDPEWVAGVVSESSEDRAVPSIPAPTFRSEETHTRLTRLGQSLLCGVSEQEKEAELVCFVGDLFRRSGEEAWHGVVSRAGAGRLRDVQELIEERCADTLPLTMLAAAAGMSRYHFVRAFRRQVGMTPHAWQIDARIRRARGLLALGVPLAEAALQLGFADQSHFQRAFKQRVAVTPREYRGGGRNFVQD